MSFLAILWGLITMLELWLSLLVVGIASVLIMVVTTYLATISPVLAVIAGAILMLLTVTFVLWIIENVS